MYRSTEHEKSKAISPQQLVELLNEDGWCINGGRDTKPWGTRSNPWPVTSACIDNTRCPGRLSITVKKPAESSRIKSQVIDLELATFTTARSEPHEVKICRLYMMPTDRKKVEGGGVHQMPVPAVQFAFSNPELKRRLKEEQRQAEEAEQERQENEWRQFVEGLGVVGKTIADVQRTTYGYPDIIFDDGSRLRTGSLPHAS